MKVQAKEEYLISKDIISPFVILHKEERNPKPKHPNLPTRQTDHHPNSTLHNNTVNSNVLPMVQIFLLCQSGLSVEKSVSMKQA